ncbi:hypothetical protein BKA80DRAFT_309304 [Phyllosticta citrichinensis]
MRNTILITLLALVVALVSGVAISDDIGALKNKQGGNSDYCKGVIGFSKITIWRKGRPKEQKLAPEHRIPIGERDIADAIRSCRLGLGKGCKMIICDLAQGLRCSYSSYAPGPDTVIPDANSGSAEFYDPNCALSGKG